MKLTWSVALVEVVVVSENMEVSIHIVEVF